MKTWPGRVQQIIYKMIASEPNGAWSTDDIYRCVVLGVKIIEKQHRFSVLSALLHPTFRFETWSFKSVGQNGEYWLFDSCNDESQIRHRVIEYVAHCKCMDWVADNFDKWRQENPSSVKDALKFAASNRDYRDASQLERLDMDIRNAQTLKGMGIQNIDIERLKAKREALAAGCHD